MIKITDSAKLAFTKLRTRKIRLFITVFIAGILFSGLFAASMVVRGVFKSVDNFSNEGFGKRYLVEAIVSFQDATYDNKEIISRAEQINTEIVSKKKAEAKKLGIEYDALNDSKPVIVTEMPEGKVKTLEIGHPVSVQAIEEYYQKNPPPGLDDLKKMASRYGATNYYQSKTPLFTSNQPQLKILKDNKEVFNNTEEAPQSMDFDQGIDSFTTGWWLMSKDLLTPFSISDTKTMDSKIPLVAPLTAIERLLELKALPTNASASEKLERIKYIRSNIQKAELKVCYRNSASSRLIDDALSVSQAIEQNKDNKEYQKPALIYGLPDTPCGPAKIVQDKRTSEQKKQDTKQEEFSRSFGKPDPVQTVLNFKIVGISPNISNESMNQFSGVVASMVGSSLNGPGWYTPREYVENNEVIKSYFTNDLSGVASVAYYVEFPDYNNANKFLNEQNCQPDNNSFNTAAGTNPFTKCFKEGKYFALIPFGSNALALESAQKGFTKFLNYFGLGILLIATIILFFTIGRTIADSRRETAVFRAIGAKRIDISQIYVLYAFFITLIIIIFSFGLGLVLSNYINNKYSSDITTNMLVIYSAKDVSREFVLFAIHWPEILRIMATIIAAGIISVVLNLLRNIRRNPIRDMRDDT